MGFPDFDPSGVSFDNVVMPRVGEMAQHSQAHTGLVEELSKFDS